VNILLCPSAYAPHIGGVEELTHRLAVEYGRQGHTVLVLTARWPLSLSARDVVKGVKVRRVDYVMPSQRPGDLLRFGLLFPSRLLAVSKTIREFRPDIVHIQCVSGQGLYLLLLKRLLGFRLLVTLQGERRMDAARIYQRSRLMEPLLAGLLRGADYVTACSQATLEDVMDIWPLGLNSQAVPNGVSLDEFDVEAYSTAVLQRPYVFATGRQVYNKGFDLLIEAFSLLAPRYPDLQLVIGGDGEEAAALRTRVARNRLEGRVHFPGYLDRPATVAYFHRSLFFVLPSRYEPFGIVNLEAMAAGKAVVATNSGGVGEVVEHGSNGLLVPPGDIAALAEKMCTLLDNPALSARLGAKGRTRVEEYFSWSRIAGEYLDIYGRLMALDASGRARSGRGEPQKGASENGHG